jgi:hypothetical protein
VQTGFPVSRKILNIVQNKKEEIVKKPTFKEVKCPGCNATMLSSVMGPHGWKCVPYQQWVDTVIKDPATKKAVEEKGISELSRTTGISYYVIRTKLKELGLYHSSKHSKIRSNNKPTELVSKPTTLSGTPEQLADGIMEIVNRLHVAWGNIQDLSTQILELQSEIASLKSRLNTARSINIEVEQANLSKG